MSTRVDLWFEQALALQHSGALTEAEALYHQVLASAPRHAAALVNLSSIHSTRGEYEACIALLDRAIKISPKEAYAHLARGHAFVTLENHREALRAYDKALGIDGKNAVFHTSRGVALYYLGDFAEAIKSHDRAIAIDPNHSEAHNNRGNALANLKRQNEALAAYETAVRLNPTKPLYHTNLGAMLAYARRHEEALAAYDTAIAIVPHYLDALINRGTLLGDMRRFDEALASLDHAIALQPNAAEAHWNKALIQLVLGRFADGWAEYEWRWQKPPFIEKRRDYPQALWLGDGPIAGKTILIHPEQGSGDFLQFCRYIPVLEAMGATVILETPSALIPIIQGMSGRATLLQSGAPLPDFDLHCPIMSLPLALRTKLDSIPANVPYLAADDAKRRAWQELLGEKTVPRVGLVWSGAPSHVNDHNRSIPLAEFAPLFTIPCEFHSLQTELRIQDKQAFASFPLAQHVLKDFAETAALIMALDLVICVDTAVAHLAGALGKTTWLLVPYTPDFRWLLDREDTPWYPHTTLLRQSSPGDWKPVVERVARNLAGFTPIAAAR